MDSESCELGSSGKRSWSESNCCRLPQAKRFNKNTIFGSDRDLKEEDDFSCISDLIQATGDCHFSDRNLRFCDGSPPDSTQKDLDDLLTSLLTESEIPNSFSVPETINSFNGNPRKMGSTSLYSGPTLMDVQSALSKYERKEQSLSTTSISCSSTIFESLQSTKSTPFLKLINELFYTRLHRAKREAKYSLKVKCPENGEDGYKWRKYGQKAIKNSPYPRSYYRCTSPKCRAKKQVEKCVDDPHTLTITYEGLHLHFPYPALQIAQQPISSLHQQYSNICAKEKTKKNDVSDHGYNGSFNNDLMQSSESPTIVAAHQLLLEENDQCCEQLLLEENDKCCEYLEFGVENSDIMYENTINVGDNGWQRDGLLENIVPFELINPPSSSSSSSSSSP